MGNLRNYLDRLPEHVRSLPAYNSGLSAEHVRAKYGVERIAKLGSNENPYGASPAVLQAVARAVPEIATYPDPVSDNLRAALAGLLGVTPDRLTIGNGSEDLIAVACRAFLASGDEFITILPSFGLHVIYGQAAGARAREVRVNADYRLRIEKIIAEITPRTRMLIFSNPSNPAGTSISAEDMRRLLGVIGGGTLLVFDEAYFEYAAADPSYPDFREFLAESGAVWLHLRTFSKAYGLAGLRVGYGIASHADLIDVMDRVRTPFNVNRLAQAAALAALGDPAHMRECVSRTVAERERVRGALQGLGYRPAPSLTNFLYFDAQEDAAELAGRLLAHGVIIKPWREAGFSSHVRVSIGAPEANDQFLAALEAAARSAVA